MARRKVILPNWSANEADSKSIEMLGAEFSGLTQGELVINTNVDNTLLSTLNGDGKVVVFESSEMIDKRLEGFLDKVHQHDNKGVLDSITSGRTDAWDKAESNAKTYTDQQIDFIVSGASEAFDTLKEVETWINNHSGETKDIIEDINSLYASAHTHSNKALLDTYTQTEANLVDAVSKKHEHNNKTVLDGITDNKIASWDAAEPNVITEISAVTKDNSNVISVNGKKVTIDLTNVGDENVIETIKVNNSALTVSNKTVNVDLSYLETAIENIELTPGPKGDDGTIWYDGAELPQPQTTVIRVGDLFLETTNSNVYRKTGPSEWSLIGNIKGDKGDRGDDGTSIKILGTVNSPAEFPGNPSNGDGYMLDGHLWVYDGVSWIDAGEIKGPQGDPGTNAYITGVTASVSDTTGVPTVKVTTGGTHSEMSIDFDFDNLKGPKGDKGTSITSIGRTGGNGAAGTTDEYTITYSDGTTSKFNVYNGDNGKDGEDGDDGITPVFTAVTASVNNATGTPQVFVVTAKTADEKYSMEFSFQNMKGEKGDKGDDGTSVKILGTKNSYNELPSSNNVNGDGYIIGENLYVWNGSTWQDVGKVKGPQGDPGTNAYITGVTASVSNTTGTPSVNVTTAGTPSNISFNLAFNGLKGEPGEDGQDGSNGNGIKSFIKTSGNGAAGTTDTYTITFTDGVTSAITVYNGSNGTNGEDGENGIGIKSFVKTNGNGAAGTTDTYTMTFTNGVTSAITVYNGSNGGDGEDGANGNMWHVGTGVPLTTLGVAGDLYLEGVVGTVYQKRDGEYWLPTDCNLKGPKGDTGTFDSSELNNYVRTDNADYTSAVNNTHSHSNKTVLDGITSAKVSSWDNAESNAVATASAYTDSQIKFVVSGASAAFDTLKEVETWIKNHSGQAETMITSINAISGVAHSHDNYAVLSGITEENIAPSFRYIELGAEADFLLLSASTNEKLSLFTGRGISISGNHRTNLIEITGPSISMYDTKSRTDYNNEEGASGDLKIHLDGSFLSVSGVSNSGNQNECHLWHLKVNTGTTKDTLAVGNHTHTGTYLTLTDFETEREDIYDAITDSVGVTLTSFSGRTYLIGCSGKTGELIRGLHTSTTDIYMEGGEVYAASDERLKNFGDNVDVDFEKLLSIPKIYYTWKNDNQGKNMIGTSAQKLREVYPELVSENEDGKMAVSYEKLSIIALAAVDKLHKENEELKDRLKRIEEKLGL